MNIKYPNIQVIEKEEISKLKFPSSEVLISDEQKSMRNQHVHNGMKLGNNHRSKVKIIFEDSEGIKAVETTIWFGTDHSISLKGGTIIPLHRVHDIRIH